MPNADVVLRSSDLVHFRVHKLVLAMSSPFFSDMFSLPQPPDGTAPDELPVVQLSEDSEVLNSLISMLYPIPPEIPSSSVNILALLAAAAKYDMDAALSFIRVEASRRGLHLSRSEVFRVYAVACSKGLIPEMETAARLTLGHPLTFESIGDELRLFEGWALRDLANFRLRSMHNFCSNWESFSDWHKGPSKIWVGCPSSKGSNKDRRLPTWLIGGFLVGSTGRPVMVDRLEPILMKRFTATIPTSVQLRDEYLKTLQTHVNEKDCNFCMKVHIVEGEIFCAKMKDIAEGAWNIPTPIFGKRPGTPGVAYVS
jgi:hypothetical protein